MLDTPGALNVISLSLRSKSLRTRAMVFEVFAAMCLIPGGHASVLEALEFLSEEARNRFRFEIIVYGLWESCSSSLGPIEKDLQVY